MRMYQLLLTLNIEYQINIGPDAQTFGYGWNAGAYNQSTWNTPRTTTEVTLDMRQWSFNNYGEDLILTQRDGPSYIYGTLQEDLLIELQS
jgi:hypothetical protein